jgi:hypothetical protein
MCRQSHTLYHKILLYIGATLMVGTTSASAQTGANSWRELTLTPDRQDEWVYVGPAWAHAAYEGDPQELIRPHIKELHFEENAYDGQRCRNADVHLAFNTAKAYSDLEAEFEFRFESATAGAGLIFGARNATEYHMAHLPTHGQTYRAKNFWAAISRMDRTGYLKVQKLELLHGVVSELGMPLPGYKLGEGLQLGIGPWHKVRVVVKGDKFSMWVDGHPGPTWRQPGYTGGYIGLESWTYHWRGAAFSNQRVRGTEIDAAPWDATMKQPQNWGIAYSQDGRQQFCEGVAKAPNGDLLYNCGGINRSTDNGKTWTNTHPKGWSGGWLMRTRDDRLAALIYRKDTHKVHVSFSDDSGRSWSAYTASEPLKLPAGVTSVDNSINPFLEVGDGTWLLFVLGGHESSSDSALEWSGVHCIAATYRSADNGRSWSTPIALDGYPAVGKNLDLTEPYATRLDDGRILALIRPVYSPWMWETWSHDGGLTWTPTTRAAVTSYACAMLPHQTASGALVFGGRFPGNAIHVSRDQGITWETYRIGTDTMLGGSMAEVAPDVILWFHADTWRSSVRAEAFRITASGIEPAPEYLPSK